MIIADTGLWVALFDRRDRYHTAAAKRLASLDEPLITTIPVITEACYLLQTHAGQDYACTFLAAQPKGLFRLATFDGAILARAEPLMRRYANLPMDFADASLVLLAEELGHGRILSTDQRDFETYRWKQRHPFENLLAPDP